MQARAFSWAGVRLGRETTATNHCTHPLLRLNAFNSARNAATSASRSSIFPRRFLTLVSNRLALRLTFSNASQSTKHRERRVLRPSSVTSLCFLSAFARPSTFIVGRTVVLPIAPVFSEHLAFATHEPCLLAQHL